MGLNAALKDKARVISATPEPLKVEGKTVSTPTSGEWFKVRLELPEGNASEGPGQRRRAITSPTLLVALKDAAGQPVDFNIRDYLEVDSPQLGRSVWVITADPAPIRKKRRVIGWTASVQEVDDHPFIPRLDTQVVPGAVLPFSLPETITS